MCGKKFLKTKFCTLCELHVLNFKGGNKDICKRLRLF